MNRNWIAAGVVFVVAAAIGLACADDPPKAVGSQPRGAANAPATQATAPPRKPLDVELRAFMRRKLDATSLILEGLAVEDLDLVQQGAKTLEELSSAEKWRVSTDVLYRQHSAEFIEIARELGKAAEEGNMDRAALKWVDATMSCLECHRCVRTMSIVGTSGR